jgi:hypothetical protein
MMMNQWILLVICKNNAVTTPSRSSPSSLIAMSSEQAQQPPHDVPDMPASLKVMTVGKKPRFHFKFKLYDEHYDLIDQTHTYVYPFLHDENNEDWLLLTLLIEQQPFKASHGEIRAIWNDFAEIARSSESFDGTKPLENVRTKMIRQRYEDYMALSKIWGKDPNFSDSITVYSMSDSSGSGTSSTEMKAPLHGKYCVRDQIKNMTFELFDEVGALEAKQEATKLQEERNVELERKGTVELKQAALGKIKDFLPEMHVGTRKGTSPGCSKHLGHSHQALDDLTNMENSMAVLVEVEKKKVEWKAMHEKRKLLEAQNKSKELELQEKRLKMEEEKLKKDKEAQAILAHALANQMNQKGINDVAKDKA